MGRATSTALSLAARRLSRNFPCHARRTRFDCRVDLRLGRRTASQPALVCAAFRAVGLYLLLR